MTGSGTAGGVLCVGRLYCDLVFGDVPRLPTFGSEVYAGALSLRAGGGAVITAAHLAQLGRRAELAAYWPAPPFTEAVRRDVGAAGVGQALCSAAPAGADPQITVAISATDDRAFLTRRAGPALPELGLGDLRGQNLRHMHIGELATLVEMPGLLALARQAGLSVSLDCSWDDGATAAAGALIAGVDVFFPNEEEMAQLAGLGLSPPFAPLTVVKRGKGGAVAQRGGETLAAPAQDVPVIDTTGAGDAFNSGFLHRWLDGAPLAACLEAGNARGAVAVQMRGGFVPEPAPSLAPLV